MVAGHLVNDSWKFNNHLGKQLLINNDELPETEEDIEPTYDKDNNRDDDGVLLGDVAESIISKKSSCYKRIRRIGYKLIYFTLVALSRTKYAR